MELQYNTQLPPIISDLGRGVQSLVYNLKTIEDKEQRSRMARTIFKVILNLNPTLKEIDNYEQIIWDHIFRITDYDLDIFLDFDAPTRDKYQEPLQPVYYKKNLKKYRFYGQILIDMIQVATHMPESELKNLFINYLASFMINSSGYWNEEKTTIEQAIGHIRELSNGKLNLTPENVTIYSELRSKPNYVNRNNVTKPNTNRRRFKKKSNGDI